MELVVTLRNTKNIDKYKNLCSGFIVGSQFASGYNYTSTDIVVINKYCKTNNIKIFVEISNFISEDDIEALTKYITFINDLKVDGIYFHDFGVYAIARQNGFGGELTYDGQTVLCNSFDVAFYLKNGFDGVVLSRELTLDEIQNISIVNRNRCDVLAFGHARLSYSKRNFLTNYFKQINRDYNYYNNDNLRIVEEQRNYRMPIIEDNDGTKIYTDYVVQMYNEIPKIRPFVRRGIIDTLFINDDRIVSVLRDYRRLTKENASFLLDSLKQNYQDSYSTGFLYQKTNIIKDE